MTPDSPHPGEAREPQPLSEDEEAVQRKDHRSAITHARARCRVCRLLATLDAARSALERHEETASWIERVSEDAGVDLWPNPIEARRVVTADGSVMLVVGPLPAATEPADGLDVERLARAMRGSEGVGWPVLWERKPENFDWIARQVVARYAALSDPSAES